MNVDVLVVDDRERLCRSLVTNFEQRGHSALFALSRTDAMSILFSRAVSVVVVDVRLGEDDGLEVLHEILKLKRNIQVIMITGHGTVDLAVDALKSGAIDFIEKPVPFPKLYDAYLKAAGVQRVADRNTHSGQRYTLSPRERFVTADQTMVQILLNASSLGASGLPVLIQGESGTGKELIADLIHSCSARADQPLVKVNCAAFPETLLDNELFGHEPGAYTGATERYAGVFERAHGGTLFLDELGDMPMFLQPKVLRAVQNGQFRRLGGTQDLFVDVRFVAATNQPLESMIASGQFRKDLFYRLNAARIELPALRDRTEDIPLLSEFFLSQIAESDGRVLQYDDAVLDLFLNHSWPGNVRELENTVRYAVAICQTDTITVDHLPAYLGSSADEPPRMNPPVCSSLEVSERQVIETTLQKVQFNKKRAAELLQISRVTLYRKIEKYGISTP